MTHTININDTITANINGRIVTGKVTGFGSHKGNNTIDSTDFFCYANQVTDVVKYVPQSEVEIVKEAYPVGTTIAFKGSFGNAGGQGVVVGYSYNLQNVLCVRIDGGKLINRRNIIA